jgi:hypothetical protein
MESRYIFQLQSGEGSSVDSEPWFSSICGVEVLNSYVVFQEISSLTLVESHAMKN